MSKRILFVFTSHGKTLLGNETVSDLLLAELSIEQDLKVGMVLA